jgi:hypothetical protein
MDLLALQFHKTPHMTSAVSVYYALIHVASENGCEPSPRSDGKPFSTTPARLARTSANAVGDVLDRLREFVRIGLIDPVTIGPDPLEPITLRIRPQRLESEK